MKMKHIRAVLGFTRLSDLQVVSRGRLVVTGMTGNPDFPNPPVDPAVLEAELNKYSALITESLDGSKKAIAARKKQRETVIKMLRHLGNHVEVACNDEMQVFISSGYEAASQTRVRTQKRLSQPRIQKIEHRDRGFGVKSSPEDGAYSYELRYVLEDDATRTWTTIGFTVAQSAVPVNNLISGKAYTFQVRALGSQGYTGWSDPVTRYCT